MDDVWGKRSRVYDVLEGSDLRRGPEKSALFGRARGQTLLVTAGTGLDFRHLPAVPVVAIDFSMAMLARAHRRRSSSPARIALLAADAECLPFADGAFESVICSCSLCSIRHPDRALAEVHRVLRSGGALLLFEHVRSRHPVLAAVLDGMTIWSRRAGTEMNRNTVATLRAAGFQIDAIRSVFLDIILAIDARKPTLQPEETL